MMFRQWSYWIFILLLVVSCKKNEDQLFEEADSKKGPIVQTVDKFELNLPLGFDQPNIPNDNKLNNARVSLGKKLFFDKQLSRTGEVSCASCHKPELAFSGGMDINPGVEGRRGIRNSPTLTNIAYNSMFMHDGGPRTLENQVVLPFDNEKEFDFKLLEAAVRLQNDDEYVKEFKTAYNTKVTSESIMKAIAAFERTLISGNSPYDQHSYQEKYEAMSTSALRGRDLFFSDSLACSSCHSGFNFTDYSFQNNGLYEKGKDIGRMRVTLFVNDEGLFKVPTLRNLKYTAPYMHDGSFKTLEEVVEHYAKGGKPFPTRSKIIRGFKLTETQRKDLLSFLESLSDSEFVDNSDFK